MDQIFQVFPGICLAFSVNKLFNAHSCLDAVQLAFAQPFSGDINKLERDASFPEIPLCFLRILAFKCAENLYIHVLEAPLNSR